MTVLADLPPFPPEFKGELETLLTETRGGLLRLSVLKLLEMPGGKAYLKRLYQSHHHLIEKVYFSIPWDCITNLETLPLPVRVVAKEKVYVYIEPCLICDTPPEQLKWVYLDSSQLFTECGVSKFFKLAGWFVICERCHLQLEFYWATRTKPDRN